MDLKAMMDGGGEAWTEERHTSFLNGIEESFVRTMLGWDDEGGGDLGDFRCLKSPRSAAENSQRLNRVLPDSATESNRRAMPDPEPQNLPGTNHGSTKRRRHPRKTNTHDQVVPQSGSSTTGDNFEPTRTRKGNIQEMQ